jgi:flagellar M-ring protein FliF
VPELSPKQVSVVDQSGALLSGQDDANQAAGLDATQLSYRRAVEQAYNSRILEILEPVFGRGNVKAQVTADLDFTVTESTAEQFRPNQGNEPAAVRSQQVNESSGPGANGNAPGGVPGALSNQPPVPPVAPINGQGQPGAASAGTTPSGETRRESTTNFEVDKTVRVVRSATGAVRRLTAAVVINHRKSVDKKGKPVMTPIAAPELEQMQSLVQEAIGFNKERGDSLQVANVPFTVEEVPTPEPVPIWREPEIMSIARSVGLQMGLVLLGLVILFGVIKPALKRQPRPAPTPTTSERVVANEVALPSPSDAQQAPPQGHEEALRLARENPATVANVVRSWINA